MAATDERLPAVLALDVDGVLLDPQRGGRGSWQREVERRFGVTPDDLQRTFFGKVWDQVLVGERDIGPALSEALTEVGCRAQVDDVLDCWFEADLWPIDDVVAAAGRWAANGVEVVLATNQEHRRAAFLHARLSALFPIRDVAYSAALGCTKSDLRFYREASRRLRLVDGQRVVFVDDGAENVEAARAHGWIAIHYQSTESLADVASALCVS